MVQRRHQKDAFARHLERDDLDDDGEGLDHEEAAHDERGDLGLGEDGERRKGRAQGERPRVAHKDRGGVAVVPEEADQGARERARVHRQVGLVVRKGDHGHHQHDHQHAAARETVEAVGQVDRVGEARHQQKDKQHVEPGHKDVVPRDVELRGEHAEVDGKAAGKLDEGRDVAHIDRAQAEGDRDEDEASHLLRGGESQRACVGDGLDVVEQAQGAREERRRHGQDEVGRPFGLQRRGNQRTDEDDDAAHRGRALLDEVGARAVGAHLLADVLAAHQPDKEGHEHHGHDRGQKDRQKDAIARVAGITKH